MELDTPQNGPIWAEENESDQGRKKMEENLTLEVLGTSIDFVLQVGDFEPCRSRIIKSLRILRASVTFLVKSARRVWDRAIFLFAVTLGAVSVETTEFRGG